MKRLLHLACVAILAAGPLALTACESSDEPSPNSAMEAPTTSPTAQPMNTYGGENNDSVGNGAYGESPP